MKGLIPVFVASLNVPLALCDDEIKKVKRSRCAEYNSVFRKISGSGRADACRNERGCVFIGSGWNGSCVVKGSKKSQPPEPGYSLLLSHEANSPALAIEILMKEKLTSSVADSIVEVHEAAHQVSKELVIDVLDDPGNVAKLATALGNIFSNEAVLRPVRDFSYFHLHTAHTIKNVIWLLHGQMRYFFRGHGKAYTESQLISQFIWWAGTPHFKSTLHPLVLWAIREPTVSVEPLAAVTVSALRHREKMASSALSSRVCSYLDSEETKAVVKESISNLLLERFGRRSRQGQPLGDGVPSAGSVIAGTDSLQENTTITQKSSTHSNAGHAGDYNGRTGCIGMTSDSCVSDAGIDESRCSSSSGSDGGDGRVAAAIADEEETKYVPRS